MTALRTDLVMTNLDEQIKKLEAMDQTGTRRLYDGMKRITAIGERKVAADMSAVAHKNLSAMMGGIGGGMTPLAPANPATPMKVMTHEVYIKGNLDVLGIVKSKIRRYMATAQIGRGPGKRPPARAIRTWVADVMGITGKKENRIVAAMLRKAIAEQGIQGTPTLEKSLQEMMGTLQAIMKQELDKLAEDLAVGKR
jgi:hypothetical protein